MQDIASTALSFAAVRSDGVLIQWGSMKPLPLKRMDGVQQVVGSAMAYAALLKDGEVLTWGHGNSAPPLGSCSSFPRPTDSFYFLSILGPVKASMVATAMRFKANWWRCSGSTPPMLPLRRFRADARLVTWGGGELQETLAEVEEVPIRPGLQSFGLTRKDQTREGDPDGGCLGFVRIMPHASA